MPERDEPLRVGRPVVSTCGSCGAPILWARTFSGRRMPVDPEPAPDGTLVLSGPPDALQVDVVGPPSLFDDDDPPRHVSHFATCPNAAQHRTPRRTIANGGVPITRNEYE